MYVVNVYSSGDRSLTITKSNKSNQIVKACLKVKTHVKQREHIA